MTREKESRLQILLSKMDVPEYRMSNYQWLVHNLGDRNAENKHYGETMKLLLDILSTKNLLRKKDRKKIEQELS